MMTQPHSKVYECDKCKQLFTRNSSFEEHMLTHSEIRSYKCEMCEKKFTTTTSLKTHMLSHSGIKVHQCDVCEKQFIWASYLKLHMLLTHSGKKSYPCDLCDKRFLRQKSRDKHLIIHSDRKRPQCDVCKKKFATNETLRRHKNVHSVVKSYLCEVCGKLFSTQDYLTTHTLIHKGIRPHHSAKSFQCNVCNERFTWLKTLKQHVAVHPRVKTYRCDVCKNMFSTEKTLKLHMTLHSDVEMHKCDICLQIFLSASNLEQHMLQHSDNADVELHSCNLCKKQYTLASDLIQHLLIHSGVNLQYPFDLNQSIQTDDSKIEILENPNLAKSNPIISKHIKNEPSCTENNVARFQGHGSSIKQESPIYYHKSSQSIKVEVESDELQTSSLSNVTVKPELSMQHTRTLSYLIADRVNTKHDDLVDHEVGSANLLQNHYSAGNYQTTGAVYQDDFAGLDYPFTNVVMSEPKTLQYNDVTQCNLVNDAREINREEHYGLTLVKDIYVKEEQMSVSTLNDLTPEALKVEQSECSALTIPITENSVKTEQDSCYTQNS